MKYKAIVEGQADFIRSCPHCGTQLYRVNRQYEGMDDGYTMQCPTCHAEGPVGYTVDEAIAKWNDMTAEEWYI